MKKGLRAAFAGLLCAIVLCGCASAPHDDDPAERGDWMPYDSYSLETWLRPVWHTREMYNETVLFVGEEDEAPLLYRPSEIRSVRSYGLNVEYTEGKDYILTGEGKIRRLRGSAIPYFETDEYYRKEPDSVPVAVFGKYAAGFQENRYIKYGEKDTFTSRQIAVTYAHDCVWEGSIPEDKSDRAGKFLKKLEGEKAAKIVFYGDSITAGCNASGTEYGGNTLPYTPSYAQMVASSLEDKYASKIECVNTSLGGANTEWGLENVEKNVISHAPDLVVIAFGMNDADLTVAKYKRMISEMIDKIHAADPDCAVVAVATSVPNNETEWFYGNQKEYVAGLKALEREEKYDFVAVADMTAMHLDLLKAKRFRDMTGNNVNHPNDFLARVYAQVVLQTVAGDNYI